jgi:hypothetical protein
MSTMGKVPGGGFSDAAAGAGDEDDFSSEVLCHRVLSSYPLADGLKIFKGPDRGILLFQIGQVLPIRLDAKDGDRVEIAGLCQTDHVALSCNRLRGLIPTCSDPTRGSNSRGLWNECRISANCDYSLERLKMSRVDSSG